MHYSHELSFDGLQIADYSEHGLGHLINPTDPNSDDRDWIKRAWEFVVAPELGLVPPQVPWLDYPALSKVAVSSPSMLEPFRELNTGRDYADQIRPFNFLLSGQVAPFGHPTWADPRRFHLIAQYESDPSKWLTLAWIDRYSGRVVPVTTRPGAHPHAARLKTYRQILDTFGVHREPKSADREGAPCGPSTRGLLRRRHIVATGFEHTGKESHRFEEVTKGLIHDPSEVSVAYQSDEWERLKQRIHDFPARQLAEVAGVSVRSIRFYRAGREPSDDVKRRLLEFLRRA